MKKTLVVLLVVFVILTSAIFAGGRAMPPAAATRFSVSVFHFLDRLQLDDELAALSLRLDTLLFSRTTANVAQVRVFETAMTDQPRPNDLLIFNMSSYLADRISPEQARSLFLGHVGALRSGGCDRMYLVAALLPLAERGGLARSRVQDVIDGYNAVGRSPHPGENDAERCRTYRAAIDKLLVNGS